MTNREEVYEIIERNAEMIAFPEEATDTLICAFDHIAERVGELENFVSFMEKYRLDAEVDMAPIFEEIKAMGERLAIHEYTLYMVFFLAIADMMRDHYDAMGIDRRIFVETLGDLKNHLLICLDLHGIWGHIAPSWQSGFLKGLTLSLGRLQFQLTRLRCECEIDGYRLTPESPVLHVHIPRNGARLDHDAVLASYKKAAEHFASVFGDEPIAFACNSWLLYPKNLEFLSEKSNLRAFCEDFKIIEVTEYPDYSETWRLFDKLYNGNPDDMPTDTSLRRAYVDLIKRGEKTGRALGVFVYEGD